jgi:hypothetical protein
MSATLPKTRAKAKAAVAELIFVSDISNWFLKSIRITDDHRLCLHFKDDFIAEVDFLPHVKAKQKAGSLLKPLQDPEFFAQVYLDHGVLTWPNGYDLAPDTVRHWAELGQCD